MKSNCADCEKRNASVPENVHNAITARLDRANRRLWILLIIVVVLLVGTNAAWLWHESQFEDITVEQEVDTGEGDAVVVGNGDLNYGEGQTEGEDQTP